MKSMSDALGKGMVLVMSLWDDHYADMLWLDSTYPPEKAGQPGSERGGCDAASGKPDTVESSQPNAQVTFSNIKFGDIGSTFNSAGASSGASSASSEDSSSSAEAPEAPAAPKAKQAPKQPPAKGKGGKQPKTGVKYGSAPEEWLE
jgi:cellulose 1,4-beta-cellobiosidase